MFPPHAHKHILTGVYTKCPHLDHEALKTFSHHFFPKLHFGLGHCVALWRSNVVSSTNINEVLWIHTLN